MSVQRLWFVKRAQHVRGPFPEPLLARYIVLGRVTDRDHVSLDHHHWHVPGDVPELTAAIRSLLGLDAGEDVDADWQDERFKAKLRWLDDRKSPDPRANESSAQSERWKPHRVQGERRKTPETVEQHTYRESRAEFEGWLRLQRQRYGKPLLALAALFFVVVLVVLNYEPVSPVKVGLRIQAGQCELPAGRGIDWSGCDRHGYLLVGADLRGAQLINTNLAGANLSYADLREANLTQANLDHADLTGTKLEGAVWVDGRKCALGSEGSCQ